MTSLAIKKMIRVTIMAWPIVSINSNLVEFSVDMQINYCHSLIETIHDAYTIHNFIP